MPRAPQHETAPGAKEGAEPELTKQKEGAEPQAANAGEKDPSAQKAQFQILADAGAYYAGIPKGSDVGHAWVRIVSGDEQTSWEIRVLRTFGGNRFLLRHLPRLVFWRARRTFLPT